ncbi:hypothetical protein B0H10DRAFT_2183470 [Mycena sp. CBHHK59/15]|nr:hypothetical protein B0H10DRAFT_2183470 [Mycena sp. CBHHK59/15]
MVNIESRLMMVGGCEAKPLTNSTIPSKRTILSFPPTIVFSHSGFRCQDSYPCFGHMQTSLPLDTFHCIGVAGMSHSRCQLDGLRATGCRRRRKTRECMAVVWYMSVHLPLPGNLLTSYLFTGLSLGAASVGPGTKLSSYHYLGHFIDPGLCCCACCLDARLVFFAEYKVPKYG